MKTIRSKDNPSYKEAVKLLRRKYRDQTGMFLIEGPRPVMDAIRSGERLQTVFLSERALEKGLPAAAAAEELESLCMKNGCKCAVLAEELFSRVSDTEHSQGVLAVACKPEHRQIGTGSGVIILDRLQDPGNIGTIIRTAEAAGFGTLIAIKGTGDIYAPKTVRAAAGSLLRVNVFEGLETGEAVRLCREQGIRIVASDLEGSVEYTAADLTGDMALVIGNEGSGVSDEIRQAADDKVRIPMEGTIQSLNAAVAAGLLMYESVRQRHAAGKVK